MGLSAWLIVAATWSAFAQPPLGKPPSPGPGAEEAGLPLPFSSPKKVTNADGSVTTTTRSGNGIKIVTLGKDGSFISSAHQWPTAQGGSITTMSTPTHEMMIERDGQGYVRRVESSEPAKLTKKIFEYGEKGQLVKHWVFVAKALGQKEEPQEIYEAPASAGGTAQYYIKETDKFASMSNSDWEAVMKRAEAATDEVKAIREKLVPEQEDAATAAAREEAARQPGLGPDEAPVPVWPGGDGTAPPLSTPAPRQGLALPSNPLDFDSCLIGTWEAVSYRETARVQMTGGTGFKVTFTRDDTGLIEEVDYSGMQPVKAGNDPDPLIYRGSATARIKAKDGAALLDKMERAGVTLKYREVPAMPLPTLGPGGLGTAKGSVPYVCDRDTLEYQTSTARDGHANCTIRLKRVKR